MRFFDYKFLILLGLTLVVYFIYREVEYLRDKVEKLENEVKNNKLEGDKNPVLEEKKFPVLALPKKNESISIEMTKTPLLQDKSLVIEEAHQIVVPNNSQKIISPLVGTLIEKKQPSPKLSPKMISVDLTSTSLNTINGGFNNKTSPKQTYANPSESIQMVQKKIHDILENSESDDDSDVSTTDFTESSKHLAIYSNDNDQFDETQNSLMESVEANKNDLKFDYNRMEIPDLKNTMESIMNNLSSDLPSEHKNESVSAKKSPIDEIIEEKEKQLSEMSSKASSKNGTEALTHSENNSTKSEQQIGFSESKKLEPEADSKSDELDEKSLNSMKLPEIKKIAEQFKIAITKKVNGQQKPKNKNELITEILSKKK